jgi:hypothetical protein
MKVNIGKYPSSRSTKPRKIDVHIDKWDTWSADHTLALIIYPLLVQLKEQKHGAPLVDDEDVPAGLNLRSTEAPAKANEYDVDENHFKRWDWVLDQMIWSMKEIAEDKPTEEQFFDHSEVDPTADFNTQIQQTKLDRQGLEQYNQRLQNGCVLMGKYFMSLWT